MSPLTPYQSILENASGRYIISFSDKESEPVLCLTGKISLVFSILCTIVFIAASVMVQHPALILGGIFCFMLSTSLLFVAISSSSFAAKYLSCLKYTIDK